MEYVTSMSNGAVDIFRGLAGLETGEEVKTDFEIHEPGALGLSLNGAGRVTVVDAGSPAEAHGIKLGDLVAALNDEEVLPDGHRHDELAVRHGRARASRRRLVRAAAIGVLGFGFGWQLGAQVMDFLIILNRPSAVLAFTAGVGVTLGASLGVSAGPGAGSESRLELGAEGVAPAWTYACTKGIYAGVSLEGASLNERSAVNERHYMRPASCKDLLSGKIPPTPAAAKLHGLLKELDDKPAPAHWRTPARDPEVAAA
ncbi:hypothetical protein JL720_16796 [Aureococcus anophagefferens]|nr:hypothetical protein JL720_16796 [Aureococcus anophagefferens]